MLCIKINCSNLVSYSAEQMYELVNDVESYPEFVPSCIRIGVLESSERQKIVMMCLSEVGIYQTFTTRNILNKNKSILIHLIDGPFKKFIGEWTFLPLKENICYIKFHLNFESTNKFIELAFRHAFRKITTGMIQIFISRAQEVYNAI